MFNYYKKETENYTEVFKLNKELMNGLIEQGIIKMSDLENYILPSSKELIIPNIEKISGTAKLFIDIVSKILKIESFFKVEKDELINCKIGEDYIIVKNVFFTTNPLSNSIELLKENLNNYKDGEIVFKDIGYISSYELEKIKRYLEKKEYSNKIQISNLKIENVINNILFEAFSNDSEDVKIFINNGMLKYSIKKEHQLIEKSLSKISIDNYKKISHYVSSLFNEGTIITKEFMNAKLKLKLIKNKNSEQSNEVDVIQFNISNLNKEIKDFEDVGLNLKDKNLLKKTLKSPMGIIFISSIYDLKELYTSLLKEHLKTPENNIFSFEKYIENEFNGILQQEIKNSNINKYQILDDYNVIGFDDLTTEDELNTLLELASKGKKIIVGIRSKNTIDAFSRVYKMTENKELLSENILGFLHAENIPNVCKSCAKEIEFFMDENYQEFSILDDLPKMNSLIKVENAKGCDDCLNGFKGHSVVKEYLHNDLIMKTNILEGFNLTSFKIEKNSNSWENLFTSSLKYLKDSDVTTNSIIKRLGYPKKI